MVSRKIFGRQMLSTNCKISRCSEVSNTFMYMEKNSSPELIIHLIELVTLRLNTIADKTFFGKIAFFVEYMVKMKCILFSSTKEHVKHTPSLQPMLFLHSKKRT